LGELLLATSVLCRQVTGWTGWTRLVLEMASSRMFAGAAG
jgi:hypothetical protein